MEPESPTPPPPPPPGAPPPPTGGEPPPGAAPGALPWEERQRLGFVNALIETTKLLITAPSQAFARAARTGDFASPLFFGVILAWVGIVFSQIWRLAVGMPLMPMMGGREAGAWMAASLGAVIVQIILAPIFIVVGLFLASGIIHLCLLLVGGVAEDMGFEGTFRAIAYSGVAQVAQVVPVIGGIVGLVWTIVLYILGLSAIHRTTQGKAAAAVLIPVGVCCACIAVGLMTGMAAMFWAAEQAG